ncbi:hypothetical protein FDP22_12490 [Paroceanicella profunda]|uniref:Uncharacterized protein n=1 Tax=Paroceanicella profunda TaxID=2579971 RepID=A0A5B8FUR7_9RHOB|nr:hypothetical protein [Paroceanicella profunda]QDL92526.1 hypothetical protein FDP22_12490 [Paroceanicella profunda]
MQTHPDRIRSEARAILTGTGPHTPSLASLALLTLKHEGRLPALRMVTAPDGTARYVPLVRERAA